MKVHLVRDILVLLSLSFLSFSAQAAEKNGGVGHGNLPASSPLSERSHVDFTAHNQDDFTGDHIPDRLICNNIRINGVSRINVRVIDGKTNKEYFKWNWSPNNAVRPNGDKLTLTGCDIVYLRPNRPSIALATAYISPSIGVRVRAPQILIHNRPSDNKLQPKHIRIPGRSEFFTSAVRSIKCSEVPHALRQKGVKLGAYCFYAGYDSNLPFGRGYGTVTAFVKFEEGPQNSFIVKDLTESVLLPWSAGMYGTKMKNIRQIKLCSGAGKYDGLHMMGGAFVDYNRDGLKDLITVGQHASIRSHKMIMHESYPEKFYFQTDLISDAKNGMSEFLRIISLDENEKFANSSCVYISGEKYNGCGSVPDHLRCFKNGKWETTFPSGSRFSSTMAPVTVKANGRGKYIIKATEMGAAGKIRDRFYGLPGAFKGQILLNVSKNVVKRKNDIVVQGWACVPNTRWRPRITISNKSHHTMPGYRRYFQDVTKLASEPMLKRRCMQPGNIPYRYKAVIPKNRLTQQKGKLFIQADFYHTKSINVKHVQKSVAY